MPSLSCTSAARVRLHIMGGVDDEEYGAECHALVDTLGVRDLIFTGRVNVLSIWKSSTLPF